MDENTGTNTEISETQQASNNTASESTSEQSIPVTNTGSSEQLPESSSSVPQSSSTDAGSIPTKVQQQSSDAEPVLNGNGIASISTAESTETDKANTKTATQEVKQQAKRFFYKKSAVPPGSENPGNSKPSFFRRLRPAHYIAAGIIAAGLVTFSIAAPHAQAPVVSRTSTTQVIQTATPSAGMSATLVPTTPIVKKGGAGLYPNPTLTTGAVLPVTSQEVCRPGYSSTVRNVSEITKNEVFAEYGVPQAARTLGAYEVDHFISLELGGSNDISNLWPEPALPTPGFHQKDLVENYLHEQVCSGKLTLQQAQREISVDWYAVYLQMK